MLLTQIKNPLIYANTNCKRWIRGLLMSNKLHPNCKGWVRGLRSYIIIKNIIAPLFIVSFNSSKSMSDSTTPNALKKHRNNHSRKKCVLNCQDLSFIGFYIICGSWENIKKIPLHRLLEHQYQFLKTPICRNYPRQICSQFYFTSALEKTICSA
jgi:hypothetical protein